MFTMKTQIIMTGTMVVRDRIGEPLPKMDSTHFATRYQLWKEGSEANMLAIINHIQAVMIFRSGIPFCLDNLGIRLDYTAF